MASKDYAYEESRENKIIIALAVVVFLFVVKWGADSAMPDSPAFPVQISLFGEHLWP